MATDNESYEAAVARLQEKLAINAERADGELADPQEHEVVISEPTKNPKKSRKQK